MGVLDVSGGRDVEGRNVQVWRKNGTPAQRWRVVYLDTIKEEPWKRPAFGKTGREFAINGATSGHVWRKARDGKWRPLTSHYFWDNNYGAQIVCRDMGFGTGVRTHTRNKNNRENFDTE